MQKLILCMFIAAIAISCNNEQKEPAESNRAATKAPVALPYDATYSSSFEMGDPNYAATILQGSWKDWENNKLDNMKSWIADTIVAFHSDNTMVRGADSLMARWKAGRAKYTSVIDSVNAVVPLYSTDKKENWVLVWATEINTNADGTKDTAAVMETWRMNKDGKADLLLQYDRAARKK